MKEFQRFLQENRNTNRSLLRSLGKHFDSRRPLSVASFQLSKVAHYNGKIKRKSKVGYTLDFKPGPGLH
jgi:hypothetical protein